MPFSSKGYEQSHRVAVKRAIERLWSWSDQGRMPVMVDTSPCSYELATSRGAMTTDKQERFERLRVLDSVAFVHDRMLPRMAVRRRVRSVAIHTVCSVIKSRLTPKLEGIGRACSDAVTVPLDDG